MPSTAAAASVQISVLFCLLLLLCFAARTVAADTPCPVNTYGPSCSPCPAGTYTAPPTTSLNQLPADCSAKNKPLNILFLIVDDLKPILPGWYNDSLSVMPAMAAMQKRGVTFLNAHAQAASCSPSRASFLTGLRPDTTQVIHTSDPLRGALPNLVTMPQRFKQAGYFVAAVGKVFDGRTSGGDTVQDAVSWSQPVYNPYNGIWWSPTAGDCGYGDPLAISASPLVQCSVEAAGDEVYPNYKLASRAISIIESLANSSKPFFLAVGMQRPHMPFTAPMRFWRQWDRSAMLRPTSFRKALGAWKGALHQNQEAATYGDWPQTNPTLPSDALRARFVHGYYASASYSDSQIARVLSAMQASPHHDDTVILLIGDHGFHLGDHRLFGKWTVYQQATRVPFIMTGPPRVIAPALWNTAVSTPVELTDMFPTLAEITGVDVSTMGLDGISFTPLISSTSAHRAAVRGVAVFQFYAFLGRQVMSYGMRANRWRYVVHVNGPVTTGPIIKDELYDMWNDPNETVSLAALQVKPPYVRVVLGQMRGIFKRHRSTHWRGVWNEGMDL